VTVGPEASIPYKKFTDAQKAALVRAWRASGLSQSVFAAQHRIADSTLGRWAQQYAPQLPAPTQAFAEVEIVEAAPLRLHIGASGHVVEVPAGFDAAELRRLVAALC
jgi:transposase-like protein